MQHIFITLWTAFENDPYVACFQSLQRDLMWDKMANFFSSKSSQRSFYCKSDIFKKAQNVAK